MLRPLDKDKNIADVDELDTWTTIPTSFSQKKEKRTQGKKPMRFYDAIVHCAVAEYAKKDLRYKGHIVSSICHRLELKEKIVLLFDKGEFDYFETYKGPADEKSPQAQFLELAADPDEYSKYLKSKKYLAMQEKIRENTIGDVLVTNKPKKSCNIEVVPKVLEKSEEVIKVAAVEKKILIEEIKNFKVEIDAVKKNGNVEVNEKESIIEIQADLPGEAGMKGVTLEATKKSIRLHCTSFAFQVDFLNYQLEDAQISAKWVKTKKRLLIACPYSK